VDFRLEDPSRSGNELGAAWGVAEYMHVSQLVPPDQKIVAIPYDGRVSEALQHMRDNAFNQLPVEARDGSIVGIFSYRSFAKSISKYRPSDDVLSKQVGDMSEEPFFVRPTEVIGAVVERLASEGSIIIGSENDVYAIATNQDLLEFMWTITQPFMLIGDIEITLRRIMYASCAGANLQEVIDRAFPVERRSSYSILEDLSLGELLGVLKNGENFGRHFKSRFNDMNFMSQNLDPVVPIRNGLFHFRDKISDEDLESLRSAHGWLNRKWKATRVMAQE
jgi:hypothetical protein